MTTTQYLWLFLASGWLSLEMAILRRAAVDQVCVITDHDQGSARLLWQVCVAGVSIALLFKQWRLMPLPLDMDTRQGIALGVFAVGLSLRMAAVLSLGQLFTPRITLHPQHNLITSGPYHWIRHPSYSGLLLAFLGAGVAMGDWFSLLCLLLPSSVTLIHRMKIEEVVLMRNFPTQYPLYCGMTKKLIPFVY